jgi:hypothetical protein
METPLLFNPLDKRNLGKSVVDALLEQPALPLADVQSFRGAGIYAIYYHGKFKPYLPLASLNAVGSNHPIYVGKAIPKGGRKGASMDASLDSLSLSGRLIEHRDSIMEVSSLSIKDFTFRCLVLDDIWIPLGESLVIQRYQPLWNQIVEGFGNHDPGAGRYNGKRPIWDELHPGRVWAARCQAPKTSMDEILALVAKYMKELVG